MPQFDPTWFPSQIFWLAVTFFVLYRILVRAILPRLTDTLDRRAAKIRGDLDAAEAARRSADDENRGTDDVLARARADAIASLALAGQEIATMTAKRQAESMAALADRTAEAETRIAVVRDGLQQEMRDIAQDVATALAAKLTGATPTPAAVGAAVDAAMPRRAGG
jgi:F-type H+-transporting ATPase subunit b